MGQKQRAQKSSGSWGFDYTYTLYIIDYTYTRVNMVSAKKNVTHSFAELGELFMTKVFILVEQDQFGQKQLSVQ